MIRNMKPNTPRHITHFVIRWTIVYRYYSRTLSSAFSAFYFFNDAVTWKLLSIFVPDQIIQSNIDPDFNSCPLYMCNGRHKKVTNNSDFTMHWSYQWLIRPWSYAPKNHRELNVYYIIVSLFKNTFLELWNRKKIKTSNFEKSTCSILR